MIFFLYLAKLDVVVIYIGEFTWNTGEARAKKIHRRKLHVFNIDTIFEAPSTSIIANATYIICFYGAELLYRGTFFEKFL